VLFIGTQLSNLYTAVDTPANGRVEKEFATYEKDFATYEKDFQEPAASSPASATSVSATERDPGDTGVCHG
jgi:hypothetical protein